MFSEVEFIKSLKRSEPYFDNLPKILNIVSLDPQRIDKFIAFLQPESIEKLSAIDLIKKKDEFFQITFRSDLFSQKKLILIKNFTELTVAQQKQLIPNLLPLDNKTKVVIFGENKHFPILTLSPLSGEKLRVFIQEELSDLKINSTSKIVNSLTTKYLEQPENFRKFIERFAVEYDEGAKLDHLFEKKEQKSLDLTLQIISKNFAGIGAALISLKDSGYHPLQITSFLSKNFRTLFASLGSWSPKELSNKWILNKLPRVNNKKGVLLALSEISKLDLALKGSKLDSWVELKKYCFKIATLNLTS